MSKKVIQVLSYKITNSFLENNTFNIYSINGELKESILEIIKFHTNVLNKNWEDLRQDWKFKNLINIPYKINSISPYRVFISDIDNANPLLFCDKSLNEEEIQRIKWLLSTSVTDYIEDKFKKDLKDHLETKNLKTTNFNIDLDYKGEATKNTFINNKNFTLIKMLFMKHFLNKKVRIGTCAEAIENAKEISFYPSYNGKHELVSDIIEAYNYNNQLKRYALFITPKIEVRNSELYLNIIIGTKVILDSYEHEIGKKTDLIKKIHYGKNENSTLYIFDGEQYISVKFYTKKSENDIIYIFPKWEYREIIKNLEQTTNITFNDIKNFLKDTNSRNDMFLLHNQYRSIKEKNLVSDSLHNNDKLDISNFIVENIKGLEIIDSVSEIEVVYPSEIKKTARNGSKIDLLVSSYKGKYNSFNLYVIRKNNSEIIKLINQLFTSTSETESLFTNYEKVESPNENIFVVTFNNNVAITINIIDICSDYILNDTYEGETVDDRANLITEVIGEIPVNSLFLIELEMISDKADAKKIIRQAFIKLGFINQFIIPSTMNINNLKQRLCKLLQCIGFYNALTYLDEKTVYTFSFVESESRKGIILPFIIKITEKSIQVSPVLKNTPVNFVSINEIYTNFYNLKNYTFDLQKCNMQEIENILLINLLDIFKNDNTEKILLLEGNQLKETDSDLLKKIISISDNVVKIDLLDIEVIVKNATNDDLTFTPTLFSLTNDTFVSIGDKTQSQRKSLVYGSKLVNFMKRKTKNKPDDNIVNGAFGMYQDRRAFGIKIIKNKMDKISLASLIKLSRFRLTSEIHCNETSFYNYLTYFSKYF
ncbi:hypothetical protein SAMN02745163_02514 [Clostridium cavendishii DSM 21758]|uniref:Uncharacterized protein n=1 Tax=Clostridium cavendishii DSM 21758 TaxID=1121302 RepID=A0A1M6LVY7_9CLOT|nr:hypothetical protein [Clostridium cavendishii]SHJ75351.1 hypothetical protein SAMN02745163_02514 [Clostridium cavendishii DSM 21758]